MCGRKDDFYIPVHGEIFQKIRECIESGSVASTVGLQNVFAKHPALANFGRGQYLAELAGSVISGVNAPEYYHFTTGHNFFLSSFQLFLRTTRRDHCRDHGVIKDVVRKVGVGTVVAVRH